MDQDNQGPLRMHSLKGNLPFGFRELLHELLSHTNRDYSLTDVLHKICESLMHFSGCDMLSIRIDENGKTTRCRASSKDDGSRQIDIHIPQPDAQDHGQSKAAHDPVPEPILQAILSGGFAAPTQSFTRGKSFWTGDTARPILLRELSSEDQAGRTVIIAGEFLSLAIIPIPIGDRTRGVLFLGSQKRDYFSRDDIQAYEAVAETMGVALAHHGTQWALRERVKELTCLYGIARVASDPAIPLDEFLNETVKLLPPGWQYPEITSARIMLDDHCFPAEGFYDSPYKQSAEIFIDDKSRGVVEICYTRKMPEIDEGPFLKEERNLINAVAETVGRQVSHHEAQWALRERVKELTCLYGIAKVASRPGIILDEFLKEIVELLPPGWQYPKITQARITLDGRPFATAHFWESTCRQSADIEINNSKRGSVEVIYTEKMPDFEEGPFLKEERNLINEVARQIGLIVEHWETEQETNTLQEQLRHADRLATIGQLSAGVAHELNEPIAAILGFAQLINGTPGIATQVNRDAEKIINSALHAREVIRKLMFYARQMPAQKTRCNLSRLVKEGLYFLESRCAKEDIILIRNLEEGLPTILADPSQLYQVLVNLGVNAIQAMPHGGKLIITTRSEPGKVFLIVEDTGIGMNPEVLKRLFIPFFTTKDVGQGTGLGLAVVHGIVTAHGGTINVHSEFGKGSSFEVCLPIDTSRNS